MRRRAQPRRTTRRSRPRRRRSRRGREGAASVTKRRRRAVARLDRERPAVVAARADLERRVRGALDDVRLALVAAYDAGGFAKRAAATLAKTLAKTLAEDEAAARARAAAAAARVAAERDALAALEREEAEAAATALLAALEPSLWATLVDDVERILARIAADGGRVALAQVTTDVGAATPAPSIVEQVNAAAVAFARERGAELVGMRRLADGALVENPDARWRIDDGTRTLLRGDVADAIARGDSTADFADAIADAYGFSPERATAIARTEIARADVAGNLAAYRESGVVAGKEWILGSEHGDDDECDEAAALGVVALEDDFDGVGDPPAHPHCVCDVLPVLEDTTEDAA